MEYATTLSSNETLAITIGNFDGVHLGHQRLMQKLRATAQELDCKPVLVTFSPHPLTVLRPEMALQCLTTLDEKLTLVRYYGEIQDSIVISFTPEVAYLSATAFLDQLRSHFQVRAMVVGENFSLGRQRQGDRAFLQRYAEEHQMLFEPISLETAEQKNISSTRIRALVSEGEITAANELLGHPLMFQGRVVHGDARGRLIGFPTANLVPDPQKLLPAHGVYVARVHIIEESGSDYMSAHDVYNSVVNIGLRPTFTGKTTLVEAHLLDTDQNLYGKELQLDFLTRLRGEQKFAGIEALKIQIHTDVQQARQILQ